MTTQSAAARHRSGPAAVRASLAIEQARSIRAVFPAFGARFRCELRFAALVARAASPPSLAQPSVRAPAVSRDGRRVLLRRRPAIRVRTRSSACMYSIARPRASGGWSEFAAAVSHPRSAVRWLHPSARVRDRRQSCRSCESHVAHTLPSRRMRRRPCPG